MTDTVSSKKRSEIMRRIKSSNTSFEEKFRKSLWAKGLRYRKNVKGMVGKPDLYFASKKLVVFLDSCFWHGCKKHCRMPNSNVEYWEKKIDRNKKRDRDVTKYYKKNGFKIIRIWEHDLKHNFFETVNNIVTAIKEKN